MRASFTAVCPHPDPLPQGEGEKQYALFGGRISILPMDASYLLFSQRAETMQKDELAIYRYRLKCVNNRLLGIIRSCVEFQA